MSSSRQQQQQQQEGSSGRAGGRGHALLLERRLRLLHLGHQGLHARPRAFHAGPETGLPVLQLQALLLQAAAPGERRGAGGWKAGRHVGRGSMPPVQTKAGCDAGGAGIPHRLLSRSERSRRSAASLMSCLKRCAMAAAVPRPFCTGQGAGRGGAGRGGLRGTARPLPQQTSLTLRNAPAHVTCHSCTHPHL